MTSQAEVMVYLTLTLFCIAAIASAIIFIALLIPMLIEVKYELNPTSKRSRTAKHRYSAFNCYLLYLAFFDLIYSLFQICVYSTVINDEDNLRSGFWLEKTTIPKGFWLLVSRDLTIYWAYININLWINAIISYSLLKTLKEMKGVRRRQTILSVKRVLTKSRNIGLLFLLSLVYLCILLFLRWLCVDAHEDDDTEKVERITLAVDVLVPGIILLSVGCFFGVIFRIWWCYLPSLTTKSSIRDHAVRKLYFFFLRIVLVFLVMCVAALFLCIGHKMESFGLGKAETPAHIAKTLVAIQPTLSAYLFLSKYDVRKYVWDLVSLSYCRPEKDQKTKFFHEKSKPTKVHALFNIAHLKFGGSNAAAAAAADKSDEDPFCNSTDSGTSGLEGNHRLDSLIVPAMPAETDLVEEDDNGLTNDDEENVPDRGNEDDANADDDSDSDGLRYSIFGSGRTVDITFETEHVGSSFSFVPQLAAFAEVDELSEEE